MKKLCIIVLLIMLSSCHYHSPVVVTGMEGKPIPAFNLLLMDSSTLVNTKSITPGKSFVVFYFSPVCPYCRAETEDLIAHIGSLKGIHVYFLSDFPFGRIKDYYKHYELNKYSNFIVGQDVVVYFSNYYKAAAFPYIAIYDEKKELKEVLMGYVGTDVIKNILQ